MTIGTLVLTFLPRQKQSTEIPVPRLANPVKVTTAIGNKIFSTWSPDGETLAYESDQAGNWDIWVAQVGSGQPVNRTADSTVYDVLPSWSPDGHWIAFLSARDGGGYFVMPAVGGAPRKVAPWPSREMDPIAPAWSPDSKELAYVLGQGVVPWVQILTWNSGASRRLELPVQSSNNTIEDLRWSPNGRWLAYCRGNTIASVTWEICLTRVSDGLSHQLADGTKWERSPTWTPDSSALYFVSDRGNTRDLWRYLLGQDGKPVGSPQQVAAGLGIIHASLASDGKRLSYTQKTSVQNVFRVPILSGHPAIWTDAKQLTFDEAEIFYLDVSPDGRVVFQSNRAGNEDIWLLPAGGGDPQPLTTDPAHDMGPRWKPDLKEIAFYSLHSGKREIWIMPASGGPARQVTRSKTDCTLPAWSPDGQEIAFVKRPGIWIVPAQGGQERQVTADASDTHPDWSPDAKWIVFASNRDGLVRLWRVIPSGGQAEPVTRGPAGYSRWSGESKQLYFQRENDIWMVSIDNREERPVTALRGRSGWLTRGLATDGHYLYFCWSDPRMAIWVADLVQPSDE